MRQPKPFFRKFTKSWYVTIGGRQHPLGKDKKLAWQRYHAIMAADAATDQLASVAQLCDIYLDWCEKHRKPPTFDKQKRYLTSFIGSIGTRLPIAKLRKKHITAWVDPLGLSTTTANDLISIVQRVFNWAMEEGHIEKSPLPRIKKPPRKRREVYYTHQQRGQILDHISDVQFRDLLDFLWSSGCRPQEARMLEASHVNLNEQICIFPPSQAKGETHERVIFLSEEALMIVERLVQQHPTGPIFRNTSGRAWTKDAIKCRFTRISKKVGFRCIAYGFRHSYATEGLTNGVDSVVLGHLMGHQDASQVGRTYQHLSRERSFLSEQAKRVKSPTKPEVR